jgi:hypothetical protein
MNTDHFNLDTVTEHYLACALWASTDEIGTPLDRLDAELAPAAKEQARTDCQDFLAYLDAEGIDATELWTEEQLGHDFFLTRNGHGTGFWDGGHGMLGDRLTQAAKTFGSADLYLGDDNLIHHY